MPAGPLPTGRSALTRDVVLASQRGRILNAMAQAVAEHGYGVTTVAHVVALAGVSRKTFYEHFSDKEDCFFALFDTGIAYVLGRINEAVAEETDDRDPRTRVATGLDAFLAVLAEEPAFSRAIILEVHAAGAAALKRRRVMLGAFAQRYRDINAQARLNDPSIPPLSRDISVALVGAILELVASRIEDGRTADLPGLGKLLTDFVARHVSQGGAEEPPIASS